MTIHKPITVEEVEFWASIRELLTAKPKPEEAARPPEACPLTDEEWAYLLSYVDSYS